MNNKKNNTYHKLISSAAECFTEKGFNASSISEIARQAGVSQGAMYTYFKGKSELIIAIVDEEKNTAVMKYNQPFSGTPFQRIFQLVCSCINEVGYPANHRLWVEIIAEAARNKEVKKAFIDTDKIMRAGISDIISSGVENGEFNQYLNREEATIAIYALIDGLISRKAINPDFNLDENFPSLEGILKFILGCK